MKKKTIQILAKFLRETIVIIDKVRKETRRKYPELLTTKENKQHED